MKTNIKERRDSALVKLKLLVNGIKDARSIFNKLNNFKEEHYGFDNGNWGINKGRKVPSEVILPGNIVSKIHIRPDSNLTLNIENGQLFITENGHFLSTCETLAAPHFWKYKTKSGIHTKELAHFYGQNCLNFNIYSHCQFFDVGKQCRFCSVNETQKLHNNVVVYKTEDDLKDVCELATKHDDVKWFLMTGGSYLDSDKEFNRHLKVLDKIKKSLPKNWEGRFKGNVSLMPPKDISLIKKIFDIGVDHPSFNLEVWPKTEFEKYCPGKAKYVGFEHILKSYKFAVELYGDGKVWCNFVAGLVDLKKQKEGFTVMAENGVIPGANIFHPEVGSSIGNSRKTPNEDYIIDLYNHAGDLYRKYNYKPFFDASVLRNSLANEAYEGLLK